MGVANFAFSSIMRFSQFIRLSPLTLGVIVLCVLVAFISEFGQDRTILLLLLFSLSYDSMSTDFWRYFTPMLLHFSWSHLIFNMACFWVLGSGIERIHSARLLLVMMALIGLSSSLAQWYVSGPLFGGMSGVVYGLFGYIWIQGLCNSYYPLRIPRQALVVMLGWFVLCWSGILEQIAGIHVANTAHTVGLISGMIWGYLFQRRVF